MLYTTIYICVKVLDFFNICCIWYEFCSFFCKEIQSNFKFFQKNLIILIAKKYQHHDHWFQVLKILLVCSKRDHDTWEHFASFNVPTMYNLRDVHL